MSWPYNPRKQAFWFGLFRFRSPLLTESILILFLRILRCFTSPRIARLILCIQTSATPNDRCRVSPFGNLRIKACVPLPEAYRSLLRPSSPDEAKASINCCNWFMQTLTYSRRLSYPLTSKSTLNFQRTKSVDFESSYLFHSLPNPRFHTSCEMVGPDGLEPSTPRLSSACSNQLSYEPKWENGRDRMELPPWWSRPGSNR